MAITSGNISVEPVQVLFDEVDLGATEGDLEPTLEEIITDVTAHQEGGQIIDGIRIGKTLGLTVALKETSVAQVKARILDGGDTAVAAAEVTSVVAVADVAGSLGGTYFTLNSALDAVSHYVWIDVANGSVDPAPAGLTGIEVDISSSDTAPDVATAIQVAVDAEGAFGASVSSSTVTITAAATGGATDAADSTAAPTAFTISVSTQGVSAGAGWGSTKRFLNLTADSKRLRLHPVRLDASDRTEDWTFWLAYPVLESITKSGENPQLINVSFKIYPDPSRADEVNLMIFGESR